MSNNEEDFLESKKLQKQIEVLNAEIEQLKNDALKNEEYRRYFFGKVIHNLKNPIGISFSFSEMILEDLDIYSKEKLEKHINVIKNSCSFSLDLLDNLVHLTKIESGNLELDIKEHDYLAFLNDVIVKNLIFAHKRNIVIKTDFPKNDFKLSFDKTELTFVINNLLSNAIRYSNNNTEILIRVSADKNLIKTEVIDQGKGIKEEEIQNLFKPFQTTSTIANDRSKSNGLGLAIAKKIINEHQATIHVESEFEVGSNFYFLIKKDF